MISAVVASAIAVIASVMCAAGAGAAVPQSIELPVSQTFTTNSPNGSPTFTYQLSDSGAEPMPAGSSSDMFVFTIDGNADITLPKITFDTVGVYEYKLSCVKTDDPYYTFDSQVYTIEVYVTNDAPTPTVLVYLNDGSSAGDKAPIILFKQSFDAPAPSPSPTPTVTPTPPPAGASAQTGGAPAGALWMWAVTAGVLAVLGIGMIVIVVRIRKAEEANAGEALVDP